MTPFDLAVGADAIVRNLMLPMQATFVGHPLAQGGQPRIEGEVDGLAA
jgi:hypothetical protein